MSSKKILDGFDELITEAIDYAEDNNMRCIEVMGILQLEIDRQSKELRKGEGITDTST